jgi:hypothetical protein
VKYTPPFAENNRISGIGEIIIPVIGGLWGSIIPISYFSYRKIKYKRIYIMQLSSPFLPGNRSSYFSDMKNLQLRKIYVIIDIYLLETGIDSEILRMIMFIFCRFKSQIPPAELIVHCEMA